MADFSKHSLGLLWGDREECERKLALTLPHAVHPNLPREIIPSPKMPIVLGYNNLYGDCAWVAAANCVQSKLFSFGDETPVPNDIPLKDYERVIGFNPANPATDTGTYPYQVWDFWHANAIFGYRLKARTHLIPSLPVLKTAIYRTGGIFMFVALATEQQTQTTWTGIGKPGSWGGHAIWVPGYDAADNLICDTWGERLKIAPSFIEGGFVIGAASVIIEPDMPTA